MKEKMLVFLDGTLESLVTAWLLKKQGKQLRAVLLDTSEDAEQKENIQRSASEFEKKLGIAVQIVECGPEAKAIIAKEIEFGTSRGYRYDLKSIFYQKYLFPKLFTLMNQYQFQKVATGNLVNLQHDPNGNGVKVFRYSSDEEDEAPILFGRTQEELRAMEFPLGSIPMAMIHKLGAELELTSDLEPMNFDLDAPPAPTNATTVPEGNESIVVEVNLNPSAEIKEVWLENGSWFSGEDLGFKLKPCSMYWKTGGQSVPVFVTQYEGGGMKAFLEQPILAETANLEKGDLVLWIEGDLVLGGARVVQCL